MTMTDPVSDFLTRIRNALASNKESVDVPASKMKVEMARILQEEGYISSYVLPRDERQGMIRIYPRYIEGKKPVINNLSRVSRPGCRVYANKSTMPTVMGGLGICIVSTSQGLLTGKKAKEKGLGGEVLCTIS